MDKNGNVSNILNIKRARSPKYKKWHFTI